jgi:hypothetical protein
MDDVFILNKTIQIHPICIFFIVLVVTCHRWALQRKIAVEEFATWQTGGLPLLPARVPYAAQLCCIPPIWNTCRSG